MAGENNGTPPIEGANGTPPVETPPVGTPPEEGAGGLPSGQPDPELIGGKFKDTQAMLDHIKDLEDKNANSRRELTDKEKADAANTDAATANLTKLQEQSKVLNDMIPDFMDNGMIVTPEMEAKAVEAGIDVRDLKINAMEFRDRLNVAFEVTGGRENYEAMVTWGQTNLNPAQVVALEKSAQEGMSELAIEGLWARFEKAQANNPDAPRISGSHAPSGLQPYADRRELYKDKDYIESAAGKRDPAAQQRYKDRLRITPNDVLGLS